MASPDAGIAIVAMTQGVSAFTTFLPPLADVRKNTADDPGYAADVRVGEVAAAGLTIGVGAVVSSLTGSAVPSMVAIITAAGMIVLYESTLRADPSGKAA